MVPFSVEFTGALMACSLMIQRWLLCVLSRKKVVVLPTPLHNYLSHLLENMKCKD